MKLRITSYKGVTYNDLLISANNNFIEERKKFDLLKQVIISNNLGLIITVQKNELTFESFEKKDGQEENVKHFLQSIFSNKTIGYKSNDDCNWINNLYSVRAYKLN